MAASEKLLEAFHLFDEANTKDPNIEVFNGKTYPKELLYAMRMTDMLDLFAPNASEALKLAARSQHICRWEIPRNKYEMGRAGYLKWRQDLKKFHVQKASEILKQVGYAQDTIDQVTFLLLKKQLKKSKETQTLEDIICLVFLNYYFEPFMQKHPNDKVVDIVQKTWRKMSPEGQKSALELAFSENAKNLITNAIANGEK
ncbi:DUF4202 domain-containing protein [Flagellimonas aquimarina]|uniref:DUF4202 domain-containing protein n=1 Tax=Flagellimonas aquimarina TaxID=2201895 RepID=A0A316L0S6_9FLAO|nr:DUF4202 domain-containing protein [Allomuricauda koreensis]PWL39506.1 DUF4202 domain-containing protein [Allomuricauda koreensis]